MRLFSILGKIARLQEGNVVGRFLYPDIKSSTIASRVRVTGHQELILQTLY